MGGSFCWPRLQQVLEYRQQVRETILRLLDSVPLQFPITQDSPLVRARALQLSKACNVDHGMLLQKALGPITGSFLCEIQQFLECFPNTIGTMQVFLAGIWLCVLLIISPKRQEFQLSVPLAVIQLPTCAVTIHPIPSRPCETGQLEFRQLHLMGN